MDEQVKTNEQETVYYSLNDPFYSEVYQVNHPGSFEDHHQSLKPGELVRLMVIQAMKTVSEEDFEHDAIEEFMFTKEDKREHQLVDSWVHQLLGLSGKYSLQSAVKKFNKLFKKSSFDYSYIEKVAQYRYQIADLISSIDVEDDSPDRISHFKIAFEPRFKAYFSTMDLETSTPDEALDVSARLMNLVAQCVSIRPELHEQADEQTTQAFNSLIELSKTIAWANIDYSHVNTDIEKALQHMMKTFNASSEITRSYVDNFYGHDAKWLWEIMTEMVNRQTKLAVMIPYKVVAQDEPYVILVESLVRFMIAHPFESDNVPTYDIQPYLNRDYPMFEPIHKARLIAVIDHVTKLMIKDIKTLLE